MGVNCAVAECRNYSNQKNERPGLIHHRFPVKDKERCKKWVHLCKRSDNVNFKTASICSDHFVESDYVRDLEHELLGLPPRRKLNSTAIPSVFPGRNSGGGGDGGAVNKENERSQRLILREQKKLVNELIAKPYVVSNPKSPANNDDNEKLKQKIATLSEQLRKQKVRILKLKAETMRLRNVNQKLKEKLKLTAHGRQDQKQKLSPSQMKILNGKRKVKWSTRDIVNALTVRSVSPKAYQTAREAWGIPLPSPRTLRRWTIRFMCRPGILTDVIRIMAETANSMDIFSRVCIISFDEMSLNSKNVVDPSEGELMTASKVQVALARGICSEWKQPIYFDFDTQMSKDILEQIITALENIGFPVHGVVSDLGADNQRTWREIGVDHENPHFVNPAHPERIIHVFADVPHMLKLLRNHILDDGLQLNDGTLLNKDTFVKLVDFDHGAVKRCPKLNYYLINLTGPERMRVRSAAQLLSHHVAVLAKLVLPDSPSVSEFIETVNNGFDILNSRVPIDCKNSYKSALGTSFEEQEKALLKLKQIMSECRFKTKRGNLKQVLLPFQKGFVTSINSSVNLLKDLRKLYNVKYLMTSRCNQDALESLFSRIRALGGPNNNPTPPEFKYRLRLLLVGSKLKGPVGANVEHDYESCEWISSKLIEQNRCSVSIVKELKENESNSEMPCDDALQYLAGYLAFKLKKQGFNYGNPTGNMRGNSWTRLLSRGGLIEPRKDFFLAIKQCEEHFIRLINVGTKQSINFSSLHASFSKKFPDMCSKTMNEFLKLRIKIQLRYMNNACLRKSRSYSSRQKLIQVVQSSKIK